MGDMIKISFIIMGIFVTGFLFMSGFEQNAFASTLTSIQSGNWEDDSTWVGAFAPNETDDIVINGGHVVTINSPTSTSGAISINSGGTLDISNSRALSLLGNTITNNGDINLSSTGSGTALNIDGTVTLTGGGTISMSDFAANRIDGVASGLEDDTLVNVNNKIQGSGDLGGNAITIDNQASGIIEANQSAALTVDPVNSGGLTNTGIMRAVGSGTLELRPGTFTNTGSLIEANDNSKLVLTSGPIINGGTVNINDNAELDLDGTIQGGAITNTALGTVTVSGTGLLNGFVNDGTVNIQNTRRLTLVGPITNNGDIHINSSGSSTLLLIDGTVTLTGGGTISMSDFTGNRIHGVGSGLPDDTLVNVDNKIQGSGDIGRNSMKIENQVSGIIEANQSAVMTIEPNSNGLSNTGIIRVVGSGTLNLRIGTFTNTVGLIEANDSSTLLLTNNAVINGGIVNINDTAELDVDGMIDVVLLINSGILTNNSGSTIVNNSPFTIFNFGIINNSGTIINNSNDTIFNFGIINNSGTINNFGKIINCGIYLGNTPTDNMLLPCIIFEDTTLTSDATIQSGISIMVDSGAVLTIDPGVTLIIPSGQNITIKDGSGVLIKEGGTLIVLQ